jgi:hypothetical protein
MVGLTTLTVYLKSLPLSTKRFVLCCFLGAEMIFILALGYYHSSKPRDVVQTEASNDFVPLDENFEKNQSDIVKWYAKIIYENDQKAKQ